MEVQSLRLLPIHLNTSMSSSSPMRTYSLFNILFPCPSFSSQTPSLFNQCPTPFASVCLTRHHLGKALKDLLWIKSQSCAGAWQSSKNLNYCFYNNIHRGLSCHRREKCRVCVHDAHVSIRTQRLPRKSDTPCFHPEGCFIKPHGRVSR